MAALAWPPRLVVLVIDNCSADFDRWNGCCKIIYKQIWGPSKHVISQRFFTVLSVLLQVFLGSRCIYPARSVVGRRKLGTQRYDTPFLLKLFLSTLSAEFQRHFMMSYGHCHALLRYSSWESNPQFGTSTVPRLCPCTTGTNRLQSPELHLMFLLIDETKELHIHTKLIELAIMYIGVPDRATNASTLSYS